MLRDNLVSARQISWSSEGLVIESYLSRGGALNFCRRGSWTMSANFLISSGVRMFLIMSIFTRGIVAQCYITVTGLSQYSEEEKISRGICLFHGT